MTPTIAVIKRVVAEHQCVRTAVIDSRDRTPETALARHMVMYLSKRLTPHSLGTIGRLVGKRYHTTVLGSVRKIEHLRRADPVVDKALREVEQRLREVGG